MIECGLEIGSRAVARASTNRKIQFRWKREKQLVIKDLITFTRIVQLSMKSGKRAEPFEFEFGKVGERKVASDYEVKWGRITHRILEEKMRSTQILAAFAVALLLTSGRL